MKVRELQNRLSHIRANVEAVTAVVAIETTSVSAEKSLRWSNGRLPKRIALILKEVPVL
jgi:hypothetical protein